MAMTPGARRAEAMATRRRSKRKERSKRCVCCRRSRAVVDFAFVRAGSRARRARCRACEKRAKRRSEAVSQTKRKAKRRARTADKSSGSKRRKFRQPALEDGELRFRAARCEDGFYLGLCTRIACPHWDHAENDRDAERTLIHAAWGKRPLADADADADDDDAELDG